MDADREIVERSFWNKVLSVGKHVPFVRDAVAAYYCAMDEKVPAKVRAALLGALVYFIFPFDAAWDILGPLGFADDAAVLATALRYYGSYMTDRHYKAADQFLNRQGSITEG